jgi:hypothetical protein
MPRAARVVFSSMPYHIISRGNNREKIFQQEEDFEKYLGKDNGVKSLFLTFDQKVELSRDEKKPCGEMWGQS